jgi:integrase
MSLSIVKQEAKKGNRIDSKSAYIQYLQGQKRGLVKAIIAVINNWDAFCQDHYHLPSSEQLVQDMLDHPDETEGIFQILHNWIQWNQNVRKIAPSTISIYLIYLRKYLHMRGIKIDREDMNDYFSKHNTLVIPLKEKKYPTKLSELQNILGIIPMKRKQLYLVLISGGLRISEALLMKKKDLNFEYSRVMITIPAINSKNKEERITFISEEAQKICQSLFDSKSDDELIFGTGCAIHDDVTNHARYFATTRRKLGYTEKYLSGTSKITLHSFRAFFISKIIKQNETLGHYLAGHSVYMKQYERFEVEELIDAYIKSEPELTIFDLTRKDNEIKDLKNNNLRYAELNAKIELYQKLILSLGVDPQVLEQKARELEDSF